MVTGLLGTKLGMTRIFVENGHWVDVTLLETGPCVVVQRKTQEKDAYEAVQLGYGEKRESRCSKPALGHFAKAKVAPQRALQEFPVEAASELKAGDEVRVDIFEEGECVDVAARTKGKGFAGVQKRHGFSGGPGGHGSNFHRRPGSVGQSADPSRIVKGKRMPGQMGHNRVTVQGLSVVRIDKEKNLLIVRGSVPGPNGGVVEVKKSVKGSK